MKAKRTVFFVVYVLIWAGGPVASVRAVALGAETPPSIYQLLRRQATTQNSQAASQSGLHTSDKQAPMPVLHFPKDVCLCRLYAAEKPPVEDYWQWTGQTSSEVAGYIEFLSKAVGDVTVPADKMIRLDADKDAWSSGELLRRLEADDIQILNLRSCDIQDEDLEYIPRLTGLEAIRLTGYMSRHGFTGTGLKYLTELPRLRYLFLPGNVGADKLELLEKCPSLRLLYFSGEPHFSQDKLEVLGRLTSLTHLNLYKTSIGPGLAYLRGLKNLKYLSLALNSHPQIDRHLSNIAGLTNLEELGLGGRTITDMALRHLRGLTQLKKLNLSYSGITGEGLAFLQDIQLQELNMENTRIGDSGLVHVGRLKSLKKLDISSNPITRRVTDAGLVHVGRLSLLEELALPFGGISDEGIVQLASLASLKRLSVGSDDITDRGLSTLGSLRNLESLVVASRSIGDDAMSVITGFTNLKKLQINVWNISDAGFARLSELKSLEKLVITGTRVTGDGLACLNELPHLSELGLYSMELGQTGLKHLAGCKSLQKLNVNRLDIGLRDEDFAHLSNLKLLRSIQANGSSHITDEAFKSLSGLKDLEFLYISGNGDITDKAFLYISRMDSLRYLHLGRAPITGRALDYLHGLLSLENLVLDDSNATRADATRLEQTVPGLGCLLRGNPIRSRAIKPSTQKTNIR